MSAESDTLGGPRPDAGVRAGGQILAAAIIGLGAGLVGSYVMNRAQGMLPTPKTGDKEPATVVTAKRLHRVATGEALDRTEEQKAGTWVHYALGGALGAVYGVAAEYVPAITRGRGVLFGLSAALVLDEVLVPAVGITKPPWRYNAKVHAFSLLSHAIFGLAVETTRRLARPRISNL